MRITRVRFPEVTHKQVIYITENGGIIKREYNVPYGNTIIDGQWVYRTERGEIEFVSAYRTDIFSKYEMELIEMENA